MATTMPPTLETQILDLEKQITDLRNKQLSNAKRTLITCRTCKKSSVIGKWVFIYHLWSNSWDDHYNHSEPNTCHIVCPKCKHTNYIYNHPQKTKILNTIEPYKGCLSQLFGSVTETTQELGNG